MVVGVTRAGGSYCALRLRAHDDDQSVVGGADLVVRRAGTDGLLAEVADLDEALALFAALLAVVGLYFVSAEEGATTLIAGNAVHEWVHDSRHLLGFPCH